MDKKFYIDGEEDMFIIQVDGECKLVVNGETRGVFKDFRKFENGYATSSIMNFGLFDFHFDVRTGELLKVGRLENFIKCEFTDNNWITRRQNRKTKENTYAFVNDLGERTQISEEDFELIFSQNKVLNQETENFKKELDEEYRKNVDRAVGYSAKYGNFAYADCKEGHRVPEYISIGNSKFNPLTLISNDKDTPNNTNCKMIRDYYKSKYVIVERTDKNGEIYEGTTSDGERANFGVYRVDELFVLPFNELIIKNNLPSGECSFRHFNHDGERAKITEKQALDIIKSGNVCEKEIAEFVNEKQESQKKFLEFTLNKYKNTQSES